MKKSKRTELHKDGPFLDDQKMKRLLHLWPDDNVGC